MKYTGKSLFELYVTCGLATGNAYRWDQLSTIMQSKWDAMAMIVNRQGT